MHSCICLGISDSHIAGDVPFRTIAFFIATLLAGMTFVYHMWWRWWVCWLHALYAVQKMFSVSVSNFGSVDLLILFKDVLLLNVLSVTISQPLSLLLEYTFTRIVISMRAPLSAKSSTAFSQPFLPAKNG